jgi:hypothetical protein
MMSLTGVSGLFTFAAGGLFILAAAMLYRRAGVRQVPDVEKGDFAPSNATSMAAADLNPMSDDDEAADIAPDA